MYDINQFKEFSLRKKHGLDADVSSGSLTELGMDMVAHTFDEYHKKRVLIVHRHDYLLQNYGRSYENNVENYIGILGSKTVHDDYTGCIFDFGKLIDSDKGFLWLNSGFPHISHDKIYDIFMLPDNMISKLKKPIFEKNTSVDGLVRKQHDYTFKNDFEICTIRHHDPIGAYFLARGKGHLQIKSCLMDAVESVPKILEYHQNILQK